MSGEKRSGQAAAGEKKGSGTFGAKHPSGRSGQRYLTPFSPSTAAHADMNNDDRGDDDGRHHQYRPALFLKRDDVGDLEDTPFPRRQARTGFAGFASGAGAGHTKFGRLAGSNRVRHIIRPGAQTIVRVVALPAGRHLGLIDPKGRDLDSHNGRRALVPDPPANLASLEARFDLHPGRRNRGTRPGDRRGARCEDDNSEGSADDRVRLHELRRRSPKALSGASISLGTTGHSLESFLTGEMPMPSYIILPHPDHAANILSSVSRSTSTEHRSMNSVAYLRQSRQ